MSKLFKTILIVSIAVFGAGILFVLPVNAQVDELVVEYRSGTEWLPLLGPIFNETNFLPGEDVTRLVRVTNNSGQSQRIATEAINVSDPNRLGDVLNLEIREGGVTRYNKPLSKFFTAGEEYLSNLANGAQTQYDYIVTFYSGAQNPLLQGKTLRFDILIGFQGEEGGLLPGAGGGAGGFLPPGLTIQEYSISTEVGETSVTITWDTSYPSTSQIIYASEYESYNFDLIQPNYGYAHAAPVPEDPAKVIAHSVTITGLTSGTTYYYRAVSHASLAISREYSFTTLGVEIEELIPPEEEIVPPEEKIPAEEVVLAPTEEETQEEIIEGEEAGPEEVEKPSLVKEKSFGEIFTTEGLLATIGAMPFNLKLILIVVLIIAIGLIILWLIKKRHINLSRLTPKR